MAGPSHSNLVEEFENSFQNSLLSLTNEHFNINDKEEVKTSVEQTIQKFLDSAKQLEAFFLQKRLLLSIHKPEQIIKEDINELRQEIQRKDLLIQRHHEKLTHWQAMLSQQGLRGQPGAVAAQPSPITQPQSAPQPPQQHLQPPPGAQQQQPQTSYSMPQHPIQHPQPQASGSPMHRPPLPQQMSNAPSTQAMNIPQPMHGMGHMPGNIGVGMGNFPQGPLAYLEQTTSNIGLPERR